MSWHLWWTSVTLSARHHCYSAKLRSCCTAGVVSVVDVNMLAAVVCRSFLQLSPSQRSQAVDVLAANLRYLCTSAQQLLSDEEQPSPETLQKHRNGLKMIVHLLHIIAMQAQKDAEASKGAENAAVKPAKGAGAQAMEGTLDLLQHQRVLISSAVQQQQLLPTAGRRRQRCNVVYYLAGTAFCAHTFSRAFPASLPAHNTCLSLLLASCAGRGRKAAADDGPEWDWQHSRQQMLLAVHDVMRTDLRTLFKGLTAAERMVNLCMELVSALTFRNVVMPMQFVVCRHQRVTIAVMCALQPTLSDRPGCES